MDNFPPQAPPIVERCPPVAPPVTIYDVRLAATKAHANGWHVHRCASCSKEWSHADASKGDAASHTCPVCRKQLPAPWLPSERSTRIVAAASVYPTFSATQSNCPGGVCPTPQAPPRRWLFGR